MRRVDSGAHRAILRFRQGGSGGEVTTK